jgi:hypothetical protein
MAHGERGHAAALNQFSLAAPLRTAERGSYFRISRSAASTLIFMMLCGLAVSTARADGYQSLYTFPNNVYPSGNLLDIDSTLYGTTSSTVYSYGLDGSNFQTLHQIDTTTEGSQFLSLTEVGSNLYGVTQYGSPTNPGKVLSMGLDGSNSQVLASFPNNSDAPISPLTVLGSQLFGVYYLKASLLSMNLDGSNLQTIHTFNGTQGDLPFGPLLAVGSTLYGTPRQADRTISA